MYTWIYYLLLTLFIVACLVFGYAVYCGLLHKIVIETLPSPYPSFQVAYKFATGPYDNAGKLFKEVVKLAPENNCFGIYYDDPYEVPSNKLRYIVGSILHEGEADVDAHTIELFEKNGFKTRCLPRVKNVIRTTFPFKATLSIYIAIYRVWSAIFNYSGDKSLIANPWMELYTEDKIHFIGMLDHHKEFYVKEAGDMKVK